MHFSQTGLGLLRGWKKEALLPWHNIQGMYSFSVKSRWKMDFQRLCSTQRKAQITYQGLASRFFWLFFFCLVYLGYVSWHYLARRERQLLAYFPAINKKESQTTKKNSIQSQDFWKTEELLHTWITMTILMIKDTKQ